MATSANENAVAKVPVSAGGALAAFVPQSLPEAWRLAQAIAGSGMAPPAYKSDPNRVMVGIMAGAEVGLTPFAALQSIAVIGNNPALWGDGMLGLVQASGKLADIEETDDGETATCRVVRVGQATPIVRTFSMADAKKAGLAGKSGPWVQYPARMRQMRARAFALRDGFADVLRGLRSAEEVRDYAPIGAVATMPTQTITAAALIEQAGAEPDAGEVAPESAECQTPRASTDKQAGQVATYIKAIKTLTSLDDLRSYQTDDRRSAWIDSLKTKRPDLHAQVVRANSERAADLAAVGDDEPEADDGGPFPGDEA